MTKLTNKINNKYNRTNTAHMQAILICRVSTKEQREGFSLDAQLTRLQTYCRGKELVCSDENTFQFDESAYKMRRQKFATILKKIKNSKEPIAIVTDKIDRLIRNFTMDLVHLEELRRAGKIELHFPNDGNLVLTQKSSATTLFQFNIGLALAKYYSDSTSDNVTRNLHEGRRQGHWHHMAPVGYLNTEVNGSRTIIPDPLRKDVLVEIFKRDASGKYSEKQILDWLILKGFTMTKNGGKPQKSQLSRLLQNPFYCGYVKDFNGNLVRHAYEALITEDLFNECQKRRKKPIVRRKVHVFTGIFKCGTCSYAVTPYIAHKNNQVYLKCKTCSGCHVKAEAVSELLLGIFSHFQLDHKAIKEQLAYFKAEEDREREELQDRIKYLQAERAKTEQKIDKLLDLRLEDGIDIVIFNKKLDNLKQAVHDIDKQLEGLMTNNTLQNTAEQILKICKTAADCFKSSNDEKKRQLLNLICSNPTITGKLVSFNLKEPFYSIFQTEFVAHGGRNATKFEIARHLLVNYDILGQINRDPLLEELSS